MADDDRFYVKSLTLKNFRCFERLELTDLDPQFNLIVGENGTGKSSVLLALAELFRKLQAVGSGVSAQTLLSESDLRSEGAKAIQQPAELGSQGARLELETIFSFEGIAYQHSESRLGRGRPQNTKHNSELNVMVASAIYSRRAPLIVRFTTKRIFDEVSSRGQNDDFSYKTNRWVSTKGWSNAGTSARQLKNWLRDETLVTLQQNSSYLDVNAQKYAKERDTIMLVSRACALAMEGVASLHFDGRLKDIVLTMNDGRLLLFDMLSDGQRALVGLVAEISRRACELNWEFLGENALAETPGLVLIDEIDLHLHPKWQRQIVGALKKIFPRIQFFATTHSPQVIGEARPEEIVLLTKDGQQRRPTASFGMDSNWILECVMEAEGRDPEIAKRIKSLFDLIEADRFDEAKAEISRLREIIDGDPEIVAAESYIWNLEHAPDEAAE